MLYDKIEYYNQTREMLNNTPAQYKKEYPFLKEVDSLALANVQLNLEKAYKNFFRDKKVGFPRFKKKKGSKNYKKIGKNLLSYTKKYQIKGKIFCIKYPLKL